MESILLWATAIGGISTAIATGGLVWVALRTLGGANKQLQLLREQVDREARPYVVLEVVPGLHGLGSWDLVVRNMGRTIARDVRMDIGDLSRRDEKDFITEPLARYLSAKRILAPSARQRVMWRREPNKEVGRPEPAGASQKVSATVTYKDDVGASYTDVYDLSTDTIDDSTPAPTQGPKVLGDDKELVNIEKAIRTLSIHLGELRR
ncbi:hypothetical protein [Antrihabitans sp. YC2-6]|uniref:hypothetical protein n=1 Tax=Antrihabitans sp. YC2-6 TaxID=2799498 RepID=UPI0018F6FCCA|nr:hypothetical protein [Antrihabitans sp. YC2-6]MBJ8343917.1 hypothetical protein [Antrihabitans sp. YC2-6]